MSIYSPKFNPLLRPQNQPRFHKYTKDFIHPKTPEIAYLLGFLWADGYVSTEENRIGIEIITTDFTELEQIICNNGMWNLRHRTRKNRQPQTAAMITNNQELHNFLTAHDYTSKSAAPYKILSVVPNKLHQYWFRGLSDGDGCFYHGPINKPPHERNLKHYTIGSTYEQDWSYMENLFKKLNVTYNIVRKVSNLGNKDSVIRLTNKTDIQKFGKFIYKDRLDIGLPRKHKKYLDIIG